MPGGLLSDGSEPPEAGSRLRPRLSLILPAVLLVAVALLSMAQPAAAITQPSAPLAQTIEADRDGSSGRRAPASGHALTIYDWAASTADCQLEPALLGGVAGVASNHGQPDAATGISDVGLVSPEIFGPPLDGAEGRALVFDSDQGLIDHEPDLDRAVGPFQFIPSTWLLYRTDGNGDGVADPHNLWDAAASAAAMMCDNDVTTDPRGALTAYFGTDQYIDRVHRKAAELRNFERARRTVPSPSRVVRERIEVVTAGESVIAGGSGVDESLPVETEAVDVAAVEPPSAATGSELDPEALATDDPPLPGVPWASANQIPIAGDWNGDGHDEIGAFEFTDTGGRFLLADDRGRPYGAPVVVDGHLPGVDYQQLTLVPLAGDWDGDGADTTALIVVHAGAGEQLTFGRAGELVASDDLGPIDPVGTTFTVSGSPLAGLLAEPVFWQIVEAHDGTDISLYRVADIVVAEELAGALSGLLGAASADGVVLNGWGWRTHAQQIELRRAHCSDLWSTPPGQCSPPTAVPGTSRHEFGLAVDFHTDGQAIGASSAEFLWLSENAADFGLFNLPSEPWHWSVDGS